jgi:hypothetical protein
MTNQTRLFLVGSATVVMVGLGVGLLAYYGGLPIAADDSLEELAYVPAEATLVAYADVQAVMNSELRKHVKALVPTEGRGQNEFRDETGIDIEHDVDRVVAAVGPRPADATTGDDVAKARELSVAIVSGRFDVSRIEGAARQRGATVAEYKGVRLVTSTQDNRRGGAVAFIKPGMVLVGSDQSVKQAIDDRAAGRGIGSNTAMMQRIGEAKAGSNAWAVGRADHLPMYGSVNLPNGLSSQLPALEWFTASGHFNGGLTATLRTEARDELAAKNLRDVIQGVVAFGRLQAGQRPEMGALLNSLQLGGAGKTVTLSFAVPGELLEKLSSKSTTAVAEH